MNHEEQIINTPVHSIQCTVCKKTSHWVAIFQWVCSSMSSKKGRGQRYAKRHPCHLLPRPIRPQPLRSLIGGSLADSVGFHVCHIGSHSHLSFDRLDDLDIFLTQRQGSSIPWTFCFIQPTSTAGFASRVSTNNTFPVWETLQAPLHVRFLPATADMFRIRVKVTCWSSSFESPTFENFKNDLKPTGIYICIPLPVLAPPTCSSTPATGEGAWKTISVEEEMNQKQTSLQWHGASYLPLSWRELSSVFSTANLRQSEAKTRNNGRFRSRSFAPWFFKRFRCTEPSSGFGVL